MSSSRSAQWPRVDCVSIEGFDKWFEVRDVVENVMANDHIADGCIV